MSGDEPEAVERLDRFWNGIGREAASTPGDLDPDLVGTVRRLHALHRPPDADPAFLGHLWRDLMDEAATPDSAAPGPTPTPLTTANGRVPRLGWREFRPHRPRRIGPAQVATAALLLLTLTSLVVAAGFLRLTRDDPPADHLAAPAAPAMLVAATLDPVPSPFDLDFWRSTMAPGAGAAVGGERYREFPGVMVHSVVAGTVTIRQDRPVMVLRAGAAPAQAEEVPAGTEVHLAAGDAVIAALESGGWWRNPGAEPTELLGALVVTTGYPTGLPAGMTLRPGNDWLAAPASLPDAPVGLTIERRRLPPDAVLPPPAEGEIRLIVPESVGGTYPRLGHTSDGSVRNREPGPVDLYVLTLTPGLVAPTL